MTPTFVKRGLLLLALLSLPAAAQFGPDSTSSIDELESIVAVVDDDIVTRSELNAALAALQRQLRVQPKRAEKLPPRPVLERQLLEQLILQRLQQRAAERRGIRIDDPALNAAVEGIARRNNMTLDALRNAVEKDGLSFRRYREQIRDELLATRLRQREVDGGVTVSEAEIDAALDSAGAGNASDSQLRERARQQLLLRKAEQEWQQWLTRLRDESYVEIRL